MTFNSLTREQLDKAVQDVQPLLAAAYGNGVHLELRLNLWSNEFLVFENRLLVHSTTDEDEAVTEYNRILWVGSS